MSELIVRGSEYSDFLTCRKKWLHSWVEEIEPVRPDGKLFFGTLFHKWLEEYYNNGCDMSNALVFTSLWFGTQDTSAMVQEEIDDMIELFKKVAENYHNKYGQSDKSFEILATELEFLVRLEGDTYMTGTIDLVYEVDGKVRFADHKTVASLTMYEEKSKMDRQISRYWWALQQIAAGVGLVKDEKAAGGWSPMPELEGKEISGFDYNLIAKDFPKEPKVLKSGKLSTDKSQKTTYAKYLQKILDLSLSPNDYLEMLHMLDGKPDQFLKRVDVVRTQKELEAAVWEFLYTCNDIRDVRETIENSPDLLERVTYRNINTNCEHMCNFTSLCKTTIEGGNVSLVKNLGYRKREVKEEEK